MASALLFAASARRCDLLLVPVSNFPTKMHKNATASIGIDDDARLDVMYGK
jgi:hypothetical protein